MSESVAEQERQAVGDAWGDEISEERKAWLEQRLAQWVSETDHGVRKGPFDRQGASDEERASLKLSGADVFWLAARTLAGTDEVHTVAEQMERLRRARGDIATLMDINLQALRLSGADLFEANLSGAVLSVANLSGAALSLTNLSGAALHEADLSGATLFGANLSKADLGRANLSGADLSVAKLSGADLARVTFDHATDLTEVRVTDTPGRFTALLRWLRRQPADGPVRLADVRWNGADLSVVDWSGLRKVGDERGERWWWRSRDEAETATRANIQLSKQLDNAGLKDDSDRFAYRAQVCQRGVHLRRLRLGRWLFSWLLFILAGYGYRPLRTLFWYLAVIGSFAFAYFQATHGALTFGLPPSQIHPLPWYEALVLSVSSFHGRGFFQPVQSLGDPVAILAAMEAVFGLFIEVSFIATFTQRYFGK